MINPHGLAVSHLHNDCDADEAIALGVMHGADIIMCVPCCHKDLHRQMNGQHSHDIPLLFDPMLRHGIMKQRFVDLLTDTFRAQLLKLAGYK